MAKNDTIILDGIIDERVALNLPSGERDEAFEFFSIQQILKDKNLSIEDILVGVIDGRDDGGLDAFFIFINGHQLTKIEDFYWPKSNIEIELCLITCKHHETFKQGPLDNLIATLSEIFDFSIERADLKGDYNELLLNYRDLLKVAYRKVASRLSALYVKVYYASRGDTQIVGDSVMSRSRQIEGIIMTNFGDCTVSFDFIGSSELVELQRKKPNFSLELPFVEYLGRGERYVVLSKLSDYKAFITDDDGKLRKYLFDSNVRGFMGLNSVNDDIKATLINSDSPDFWWLNNGVTILATSARVIGKSIHIEDIQIVNGLQTTESIYQHFQMETSDPNDRSVLVKVLVSREVEVRDAIIRATNNQTAVEIPALHATDKIQKDIEEILLRNGLYYERRTNFYQSQNISNTLIISPLYLAACYVALIQKDPFNAATLKSKFMRKQQSYSKIFSESVNLLIWPIIAKIVRKCDEILEKNRVHGMAGNEGFLKKWRHILGLITISRKFGTYIFNDSNLINLDLASVADASYEEVWEFIMSKNKVGYSSKPRNKALYEELLEEGAMCFKIKGAEIFRVRKNNQKFTEFKNVIDEAFVARVNSLLPIQPWKTGIEESIAKQLNCSSKDVIRAKLMLIREGFRFQQKKGVVYDKNGLIIAIDKEKVLENISGVTVDLATLIDPKSLIHMENIE